MKSLYRTVMYAYCLRRWIKAFVRGDLPAQGYWAGRAERYRLALGGKS